MSLAFVHLSDIHFGQEKGGDLYINNDVKERLIDDVRQLVAQLPSRKAAGLIVTGDIAYAGKEAEYKEAGLWLDRVAQAAGCKKTDIQLVPGNHDIDRDEITKATELMLQSITTEGQQALDGFLRSPVDTALLYRRFLAYQPFAQAYRCPLDDQGGQPEAHVAHLAEGRSLRFIRLNSALICSKRDTHGKLILGARQRVIAQRPGEEIVVLSHHPLGWFQDSEDATRYIRNRARVFISGHEHNPSVRVESVRQGQDVMMLAAGATVPPTQHDTFTYTYNVIEFGWEPETDSLEVKVRPRAWDDEQKRFVNDAVRLGGQQPRFVLGCPNFRGPNQSEQAETVTPELNDEQVEIVISAPEQAHAQDEKMTDEYSLLLLRFFRDISPDNRLKILVDLGAIPPGWTDALSQPNERRALDALVKKGRLQDIVQAVDQVEQQ
ncbi:metallophosphoesterase [Pseudomonas sp. WHRI 8519]|uniref:metallophosphoesterase n=1 Tax=Pseudomonas sp. WHRI 8519 TaxID=3162567 RepID=UPI0032F039B5